MTNECPRRFTVVSFHAHPDDEAILTAGTLARLSAAGHRVVLVIATAGEAGLTTQARRTAEPLGQARLNELQVSAAAIGVEKVVLLGYADSGYPGPESQYMNANEEFEAARPTPFADVDVDIAAARLAAVLREERADVLTTYDRNGGYGHPDHVQVHRVGARAAEMAGDVVVLEATIDRTALLRAGLIVRAIGKVITVPQLPPLREIYTARAELTHRVNVRSQADAKRAAMAAHVSQTETDADMRTLALFLRLPRWLFRRVFRYEWYREPGRNPSRPLLDDLFTSMYDSPARVAHPF